MIIDEREHVFVVGSARSGTSLLASILQNSPDYASYHAETKLLDGCEQKYGALAKEASRKRFLQDWLKSRQYKRSGLSRDEATDLVNSSRSYIALLSAYMNRVADKQGCDRWIDSTPDNSYHLDAVARAYPNAKVIHMIRDGRAVALSLAKLGWSGVGTDSFDKALLYAALKWQGSVVKVRGSSGRLQDRYLEVRYEDFVHSPEDKIRQICGFLQVPVIDDLVINDDASKNLYSTLHTPNTPFSDLAAGISTAAAERWKTALTQDQIHSLEIYIGSTLQDLGYTLTTDIHGFNVKFAGRLIKTAHLVFRRSLKNTAFGRLSRSPLEIGMD